MWTPEAMSYYRRAMAWWMKALNHALKVCVGAGLQLAVTSGSGGSRAARVAGRVVHGAGGTRAGRYAGRLERAPAGTRARAVRGARDSKHRCAIVKFIAAMK